MASAVGDRDLVEIGVEEEGSEGVLAPRGSTVDPDAGKIEVTFSYQSGSFDAPVSVSTQEERPSQRAPPVQSSPIGTRSAQLPSRVQ